jgi:hypothetical protein
MFSKLLSVLGIQTLLNQAKHRVESLVRNAEEKVKAEAKTYGIIAALALAAATMGLLTLVVVLVAVFSLVDRAWGQDIALLTVVLIPAALAATFAVLLVNRINEAKRLVARLPQEPLASNYPDSAVSIEPTTSPAVTPSQIYARTEPPELRSMLSGALGDFLGAAPTTGTPIDRVIHQFTREAAAASDKTVELAAEAVSRGSRKAVFGVLASTVVLGWFLTRKSGPETGTWLGRD